MRLMDIEERIPAWYAASLEEGGPSWYLSSKPGRGKSSVMRTAPQHLKRAFGDGEYGIVIINGACLTLSSASGYLWPVDGPDGAKYSRFTRPDWWITSEGKPLEAYQGGVILVDEEDKIGTDEKKIVGEAALSKRFASHQLPAGWVVWFAGNNSTDRSGSTKKFDHLINRRNEIKVTDDIESLAAWMRDNGCIAETVSFAEDNAHLVFMDAPEDQGPWMTPRSLCAQDAYLRSLMQIHGTDKVPTDPLTIEEVQGGVGAAAAAQLFVTIRLGQDLPDYADIIKSPMKAQLPSKPDARRLVSYKVAARVKLADADGAMAYIQRLPEEYQAMFIRMAVSRNKMIVTHKAFHQWCKKFAGLIGLLAKVSS